MPDDIKHMRLALDEAQKAFVKAEVPVGAIIVKDGEVIGRGHNQREQQQLSKAHAEMLAIEDASRNTGTWRLEDCTMYVTLEPCPMCAGAIIQSRINTVVYGTEDHKNGSRASGINVFSGNYSHKVLVRSGILEDECADILKKFFFTLRKKEFEL